MDHAWVLLSDGTRKDGFGRSSTWERGKEETLGI